MITSLLFAAVTSILPLDEEAIVNRVAGEYSLTAEQTALLSAIRRTENGRKAIAFGVIDKRCRTYEKQAKWAANTIRKRYTGDINAFAKRWCPNNWNVWSRNAKWFMRKQGFIK